MNAKNEAIINQTKMKARAILRNQIDSFMTKIDDIENSHSYDPEAPSSRIVSLRQMLQDVQQELASLKE